MIDAPSPAPAPIGKTATASSPSGSADASTISISGNLFDYGKAQEVRAEFGPPPKQFVTTPNPDFDQWIEKVALRLCGNADEWGTMPTPCAAHLHVARDYARHLGMGVNL